MTVRLGTHSIAWSNDDLPELGGDTPLEVCLAEAAEAGFVGIEKGNKMPNDPTALVEVLARHGLRLVSGWYGAELRRRSVKEERAAMAAHLALLKACGCKVMVFAETHGTVQGRRDVPVADRPVMAKDEWTGYLQRLSDIAGYMADEGIQLAFHHHMGTVIEKAAEIDRLLDQTPDRVGLLLDTGHLTFAGNDPVVTAKNWASRVVHVHAKDVRLDIMAEVERKRLSFLDAVIGGVFTVPGDGCVDFEAVLRPIKDAGYHGWLVVEAEQDPAKAHPLTYAKMGYAHLREAAEKVGFKIGS